ncbi:hypothetical protein [Halococcus salsus]|uniref:hypothetical protein n=1 Tax=Halococcus salsus TaxID=2162894 RepID=UPI00135A5A5C|nr:hypothetical protein [Halococcus salsus]
MAATESVVGRFSGWYRRTPVSLEFWEGVLTDERLIWCFVGESFRSLLLRADMGTTAREEIASLAPDAVAAFDDRNRVVALDDLDSIRLSPSSRLRRSSLVVAWNDEQFDLEATSASDSHETFVESLADDERFAHVEIAVERTFL